MFDNSTVFCPSTAPYQARVMGKPAFCIWEIKGADQLRVYRAVDQRLSFHYIDSTIPQLLKSESSTLLQASVVVQPSLCRTLSETSKTVFFSGRVSIIRARDVAG